MGVEWRSEWNSAERGQYAPLYLHLVARSETERRVSFDGIESIPGFRLHALL